MKRVIFFFLFVCFVFTAAGWSQTATLNFQGVLRLPSGEAVLDGNYSVTFKIYNAHSGGDLIWEETQTVYVQSGIFSADLGSENSFTGVGFNEDYWVGISVEGGSELTPRTRLTTAPYAMALKGESNTFPGSGTVGIGTNNPDESYALGVVGSAYFDGVFEVKNKIQPFSGQELQLATDDGTPRLLIKDNGSVGIATSNPGYKLTVGNGTTTGITASHDLVVSDTGAGRMGVYTNNAGLVIDADVGIFAYDYGNGQSKDLYLNYSYGNNVGIGTASPQAKLHVNGTAQFNNNVKLTNTSSINLLIEADTNNLGESDQPSLTLSQDGGQVIGKLGYFDGSNDLTLRNEYGGAYIKLHEGGYVRIGGAATPPAWDHNGNADHYHYDGDGEDNWGQTNATVYMDGWLLVKGGMIAAYNPVIASDARTKNIIGPSNTRQDLKTLQQVEITDYRWIDRPFGNNNIQKKVIAQQLQKAYPEAVTQTTNVIPNVYENASEFSYNPDTARLTITTSKAHDFQSGDMVDIYTDKENLSKIKVEQRISENAFVIHCNKEPENVFVYGKWVDDFLGVDYDALTTLTISATQELIRRVEKLEAENARLAQTNADLRSQLTQMSSDIQTILYQLDSKNSSDRDQVQILKTSMSE